MPRPELVVVTPRRLSPSEWQQAIDDQDFLVPLVLRIRDDKTDVWTADLGGRLVSFGFREIDLETPRRGSRYAFSTPGCGDMLSCAASGMALLAYAVSTGGAFFDLDARTGRDIRDAGSKQQLDAMLSVVFDKMPAYEARYPADAGVPTVERTAVATML